MARRNLTLPQPMRDAWPYYRHPLAPGSHEWRERLDWTWWTTAYLRKTLLQAATNLAERQMLHPDHVMGFFRDAFSLGDWSVVSLADRFAGTPLDWSGMLDVKYKPLVWRWYWKVAESVRVERKRDGSVIARIGRSRVVDPFSLQPVEDSES